MKNTFLKHMNHKKLWKKISFSVFVTKKYRQKTQNCHDQLTKHTTLKISFFTTFHDISWSEKNLNQWQKVIYFLQLSLDSFKFYGSEATEKVSTSRVRYRVRVVPCTILRLSSRSTREGRLTWWFEFSWLNFNEIHVVCSEIYFS